MVTIWLPENHWEEQRPFVLRLYSPPEERICFTFQPLKPSDPPDPNPRWEDWHCYLFPLRVGLRDYELLLKDYLAGLYPTCDPIDGTPEDTFDPCFLNWLGAEDWQKLITAIQDGLGTASKKRRRFYDTFLRWLEAALTHTDIIAVEGNQ